MVIANLTIHAGDIAAAQQDVQEALGICRRIASPPARRSRCRLGRTAEALGEWNAATEHYRAALSIYKPSSIVTARPARLVSRGSPARRANLGTAREASECGPFPTRGSAAPCGLARPAGVVDGTAARRLCFETGLMMQSHAQDPRRGYDAAALETSERSKARSLVDLLVERANTFARGSTLSSPPKNERAAAAQCPRCESAPTA